MGPARPHLGPAHICVSPHRRQGHQAGGPTLQQRAHHEKVQQRRIYKPREQTARVADRLPLPSLARSYQQKMSSALAEVELTRVQDDPYVHFGDVLQLVHLESGAVLACDVSDRVGNLGRE